MTDERKAKQDAQYADEPWAKLATAAGFRPWTTESSAREAFRYCAENMVHRDLVDALAAALKPIAAEADAWEGCDAIDRIVESLGGYSGEMTVGDLRRAAAALAAYEARK